MDNNVLMDGWVCEQFLLHESRDLLLKADIIVKAALERKRLFISVLSYAFLREQIKSDRRKELDAEMVSIQRIALTDEIVVSLTSIPTGLPLRLRLEAATAYCKNLVFVTAEPSAGCTGMLVVPARQPAVIAIPTLPRKT